MLLTNKTTIVFGAGGAIGSAVARAFAAEGARLFLSGRALTKVEALAQEIDAGGGKAFPSRVGALDEGGSDEHVAAVVRGAGRVDVMMNAIGFRPVQAFLWSISRRRTSSTRSRLGRRPSSPRPAPWHGRWWPSGRASPLRCPRRPPASPSR